jgi:D-serine deaminase-like pyridoxal phosphate-dependent protein
MMRDPEIEKARLDAATAHLDPPFAVLDVEAFEANAADLARRAAGTPIRVASKSLRCRWALHRALASDACAGVMAFTLSEALWLAELGQRDLLVAYPSVDRGAFSRLCASSAAAARITVMIDHTDQLDLIDAVVAPRQRPEVRVCLDLDASLRLLDRVHLGVRRSPVHHAAEARRLAEAVVGRPGFHLDGLMAYEGQIAGLGDAPSGRPWMGPAIRVMQRTSAAELAERRAQTVAAVREVADLRFVNGGGTGSLETTAAEPAVTEVTAGSGFFGPALFDDYRAFTPRPAAMFALPVVRRPAPGLVTLLGGGYPASGAAGADRLPKVHLPTGLRLTSNEGAGEVQTPVRGAAADRLAIGDRVWLRHAKAGELCERFEMLYLVAGDEVVDEVPTYRGEGRCFL